MDLTPEERAEIERFESGLRRVGPLRHGRLGLGGGFVLCLLGAFASHGTERFMLLTLALFVGGLGLPILVKGSPRLEGAAHVVRFLLGIVLLLAGLGLAAAGVVLFMAGSYGILASFVVVPLAILPLAFGWSLLSAGRSA